MDADHTSDHVKGSREKTKKEANVEDHEYLSKGPKTAADVGNGVGGPHVDKASLASGVDIIGSCHSEFDGTPLNYALNFEVKEVTDLTREVAKELGVDSGATPDMDADCGGVADSKGNETN